MTSLIKAEIFAVATFGSTGHAMAAEQALISAGIQHIVMPLPTAIDASCGLAIKIWPADVQSCQGIFAEQKLEFHIYEGVKKNKKETYEIIL